LTGARHRIVLSRSNTRSDNEISEPTALATAGSATDAGQAVSLRFLVRQDEVRLFALVERHHAGGLGGTQHGPSFSSKEAG
jgi:hypothetical protein